MDRYYDRVESPHFGDAALDDPERDPKIIGGIIAAAVLWPFEDPYRAEPYPDGIRILHSEPVVYDGITYVYRVAYTSTSTWCRAAARAA